ncbi:MAG: M28 family peptidase [Clostridiaceae bacterium]|nr:M28 family peptidase [Clostridiaceae bacterium]
MMDSPKKKCGSETGARFFVSWLTFLIILSQILFSGCLGEKSEEEVKPADFGFFGANTAVAFATSFPERYAYSEEEREAGQFIREEFEKMGYTVEVQEFYDDYRTKKSANYIVRIPGEGFMHREEGEIYSPLQKTVVVGAHYDISSMNIPKDDGNETQPPEETEETEIHWVRDGIQSNASGVACLLTIADRIRVEKPAYDIILVAFGAGTSNFRGAREFLRMMNTDEKEQIDVMYCIESIYAGDKLYASSGMSSLIPGRKYEFRRKLYEAYDVVYNHMLRSKNGVDLYYNMSTIQTDLNGDDIPDIYREVTLNRSDYVPFDEIGIPIVFFESYDYNATEISEMKETKNLNLQEAGGMIRGTALDSTELLSNQIEPERLELRINNTAYIIIESIKRGAHNALSTSEYQAGVRLDPIIRVTETVPYQSMRP